MTSMRFIPTLLGAVAVSAAPPSARAQAKPFEGAVTMRIQGVPGEVQAYVKGARARLELQGPMGAMAMIMDPTAHKTYMVVPAQQMVMVMDMDAAAQMADSMAKAAGVDPASGALSATGRKETVAGHECEVYHYRDAKNAFDVCVARGLGTLAAGGLFGNPMGGMGMGRRGGDQPGAARGMDWRSLIGDRGFPLRMADSTGTVLWEITRIESKAVDDSLFVVPANYQRMDLPGFGRRPPR